MADGIGGAVRKLFDIIGGMGEWGVAETSLYIIIQI